MTKLGEISPFGYFFFGHFLKFYIYQQFVVLILTLKSRTFKVNFDNLVADLATFPKIGKIYFQSSGHSAPKV